MKVPTGFFSCPSSLLSYSRDKYTRYSDISPAARRKMRGRGGNVPPRRSLGSLLAGTWRPPEGGHLRTIACSSPVYRLSRLAIIRFLSAIHLSLDAPGRPRGGRGEAVGDLPAGDGRKKKEKRTGPQRPILFNARGYGNPGYLISPLSNFSFTFTSMSVVMAARSYFGAQPHSSRAQVSSMLLGQLSAMACFTGSIS